MTTQKFAFSGLVAAALAAVIHGVEPFSFGRTPKVPLPSSVAAQSKRQRRRIETRERTRAMRRAAHEARRIVAVAKADIKRQKASTPETAAFRRIVAAMTNNERNRWARAGYPGLQQKDPSHMGPHGSAARRRIGFSA